MHPQLEAIVNDLATATDRLQMLQSNVLAASWDRQPEGGGWSMSECIDHLNLTTAALLPALRAARGEASRIAGAPPRRYRFDFTGFLIWKVVGPSCRFKTKTTAAFVPAQRRSGTDAIADFVRLQAEVTTLVEECDNLPIGRVTMRSPFNGGVRFNLYAAFRLLSQHQHRHLAQAARVAARFDAADYAERQVIALPVATSDLLAP